MRWSRFSAAVVAAVVMGGCARQPVESVEWTVMGTVAAVRSRGAIEPATVAQVKDAFAVVETLLNAHNPESELCRLAGLSDAEVVAKCDARVRECYQAAFELARQTGGAFSPRWRGAGTLDLGAIAKGFAVDVAARELRRAGLHDTLIDLGGNLMAVKGDWNVGIKDGGSFTLKEGEACATSARYFRGDHIFDGRSGAAVSNSVYSVTVVYPGSAMIADGLSTTLFILGEVAGGEFIRREYPAAIWYNTANLKAKGETENVVHRECQGESSD